MADRRMSEKDGRMSEIDVRVDPGEHRYEARVGGAVVGHAEYFDEAGRRVFTHTEVDADAEGQGVASALVRAALDDVRGRGLPVVAQCPFVAAYIDRHPEYGDLLAS